MKKCLIALAAANPYQMDGKSVLSAKGKRMSKRKQKRKVNHLFAKLIVCYCVVCGTAAVAYCLRAQANGMDMATILGVTLGFFGGELMMLCLKTIFGKEKSDEITV